MKALLLLITIVLISCSKTGELNCYSCSIRQTTSSTIGACGFPLTTGVNVDICDVTYDDILELERLQNYSRVTGTIKIESTCTCKEY